MIARAESSPPRPADLGGTFVLAALAAAAFLFAWSALHVGFYTRDAIPDTPHYESYAERIEAGDVPYRDFEFEYPPLAIPVIALPELAGDDYDTAFDGLMAVFGAVTMVLVVLTLRLLGAGGRRTAVAVGLVAVAPLLLGSVLLTRFDLWPVALTAGALAAIVAGRLRLAHGVLGLAVCAKLYPLVLLPLTLAFAWRRHGRQEALRCAAVFALVVAVVYVPLLVIAPGGVLDSVGRQLARPLQIESLGSAVLLAGHDLFGYGLEMRSSHGSQNLAGGAAAVTAVVLSLVQIGVLVWIWTRFVRGPLDAERLLLGAAAALCAFVALGKVLSPQFLIWLVPLVPLVRGRRGLAASGLLALRDLVLVALLVVLVTETGRESPRSS
jgi:Glycosyltransferase family 87